MYVLEVKRSARRVSAAAGAWVRDRGSRRAFASKADALAWARGCTDDRTVWVQDVPPAHGTDADGYLVARRIPRERQEGRSDESPGEQSPLRDAGAEADAERADGSAAGTPYPAVTDPGDDVAPDAPRDAPADAVGSGSTPSDEPDE